MEDEYWLLEAVFTTKRRGELAKRGLALPDGSYPTPDLGFLDKAIKAWGRAPKEKRAQLKRYLRKRAKALNAPEDYMERINKLAEAEADDLEEADLSLDQQSEKIRDAWRELVRGTLGSGYDSWCSEVYAEAVIVKQSDDYWRVPYSTNAEGEVVFDRDNSEKVERQWISVTEAAEGEVLVRPIAEAAGQEPTGSEWEVNIIKAGASKNGKYYPEKMLKESAPLFEGVRVLTRSDDDHLAGRNKSVENIVGWIDGVSYKSKALRGTLHLSEAATKLRTLLVDAWNRGKRDLVGLSIVGAATGMSPVTKAGRRLTLVEGIRKVSSVDVIFDAAAGGELLDLVAAEGKEESEVDFKKLVGRLAKATPEVIRSLLAEAEEEELNTLYEAAGEELADKIRKALEDKEPKPKPKKDPARLAEGDDEDDEDEDLVGKRESRWVVREALDETKLPDPVRKRIEKRFRGREFPESELTEAISDELDTWKELEKENLVSRSAGTERDPDVSVGVEEADRWKAAFDGMLLGEAQELDGEKIRPYRSLRQAYIEGTGDGVDGHITGHLPRRPAGKLGLSESNGGRVPLRLHGWDEDFAELVLSEAISTTGFGEILGDSVTRKAVADYRRLALDIWRPLVNILPLQDVRTQRRTRYGGYANLATVAQGAAYAAMTSPTDEEATYSPAKRGGTETINIEAIINDDLGEIRDVPRRMARAAAQTLHEFVFDFLATNPAIYDAVALFHATHANLGATALGVSSLSAAHRRMMKQTEKDNSKRLGLVPAHLWVPIDLRQLAYELTVSEQKPGTADNDANYVRDMSLTYHVVPYWTDTNDWFLSADTADTPTIELGFYGPEEPEIFTQDMPNVGTMFTNDQLTYKIRHWYGSAVTDFRGLDGSVVA